MNKTTYLTFACAALLIIGGLYYFFREEPRIPEVPTVKQEGTVSTTGNLTFAGSSIVEEQNGRKVWEFNAESIEADAGSKLVYLKKLTGTFYQEKGGKVEVTAPEGILDTKTHDLTLQGKMRVTSSDGAVFTAPQGKYVDQTKIFTGTGGITLTNGDTVITGDKIDADINMEQIKVQGNAKAVTGGKN